MIEGSDNYPDTGGRNKSLPKWSVRTEKFVVAGARYPSFLRSTSFDPDL
jgi:hypothetical protein